MIIITTSIICDLVHKEKNGVWQQLTQRIYLCERSIVQYFHVYCGLWSDHKSHNQHRGPKISWLNQFVEIFSWLLVDETTPVHAGYEQFVGKIFVLRD